MEGFTCSACGGSFQRHERYDVDSEQLCPNCAEWLSVNCSECGKRILKTNNKGDNADPLCPDCWDKYVFGKR